jgi:hypothetical protein
MILAGWSATMLIAANTALGSAIGHALTEGQLFLAGWVQLTAPLVLALAASFALTWLMPRLISARLFPRQERANRLTDGIDQPMGKSKEYALQPPTRTFRRAGKAGASHPGKGSRSG